MEKELGLASLDKILESHLLPEGGTSPLRRDQFDKFIAWRTDRLSIQARDAMGPDVE
jgi:hypothetical protein